MQAEVEEKIEYYGLSSPEYIWKDPVASAFVSSLRSLTSIETLIMCINNSVRTVGKAK